MLVVGSICANLISVTLPELPASREIFSSAAAIVYPVLIIIILFCHGWLIGVFFLKLQC